MELVKNIGGKILIVMAIITAIVIVGMAGQLDHDEYIEANLTPQVKMQY